MRSDSNQGHKLYLALVTFWSEPNTALWTLLQGTFYLSVLINQLHVIDVHDILLAVGMVPHSFCGEPCQFLVEKPGLSVRYCTA
jgi:hypothetical protein